MCTKLFRIWCFCFILSIFFSIFFSFLTPWSVSDKEWEWLILINIQNLFLCLSFSYFFFSPSSLTHSYSYSLAYISRMFHLIFHWCKNRANFVLKIRTWNGFMNGHLLHGINNRLSTFMPESKEENHDQPEAEKRYDFSIKRMNILIRKKTPHNWRWYALTCSHSTRNSRRIYVLLCVCCSKKKSHLNKTHHHLVYVSLRLACVTCIT